MKLYMRFLSYLKKYWYQLMGVVICMIVGSACNVAIIPLVGKLSEAITIKDRGMINLIIPGALALYFVRGLFVYGQVYLSSLVGQEIIRDLRTQLFRKLTDLSLDFFAKSRTGDLVSRIIGDIGVMQDAMVSSATDILPNFVTLVGIVGYLLFLNWRLTLLSLVMVPLLMYAMSRFGREMRAVAREARKRVADIASIVQETALGIRIVKSFTMEKHENEKFREASDRSFWMALREAAILATQTPVLSMIQSFAVVAIIWFASAEVIAGKLSPSELISFFTGVALLAEPISKLSKVNVTIQRSLASSERVFEIADREPTVKDPPSPVRLERLSGSVEFKNVSFKYDASEGLVLKEIDVRVRPGEVIALVGPSGAGKTTFVNLIPRFYDISDGSILVDGLDIRKAQLFSLRRQIGIVPQETTLFRGTIKENIAYGRIEATDNEIIEAAKMANAHNFITEFPAGYGTLVGERGFRLSGGQQQRIAIARALLRDPRILILDEATSSLDTESERLVQDALEHLMKGRTTFVIAHRLSTVQIASRILVLEKGKIIEQGSHGELLKKGGLYKKLYEMQFRDSK